MRLLETVVTDAPMQNALLTLKTATRELPDDDNDEGTPPPSETYIPLSEVEAVRNYNSDARHNLQIYEATSIIQNFLNRKCIYQTYSTKILIENYKDAADEITLHETPIDTDSSIAITDDRGQTISADDYVASVEAFIPCYRWPTGVLTITYKAGYKSMPHAIFRAARTVYENLRKIDKPNSPSALEAQPPMTGSGDRSQNEEAWKAYREQRIFERDNPVKNLLPYWVQNQIESYRKRAL